VGTKRGMKRDGSRELRTLALLALSLIACVAVARAQATPPLQATLLSLDHQHFPFIYLSVSIRRGEEGVLALSETSFELTENDISQTGNNSFEVVPPATGGGVRVVDVVFLMDNSGSMGDEQDAVREHVSAFVDDLAASGVDYQLGLCRFGAREDGGAPILEDAGALTSDVHYFKDALWSRNRTQGGFEPGWDALFEAARGFAFRKGAQKVFILITDETPTDNQNIGDHTQKEAIEALRALYVTAFALIELSDDHAVTDYGVVSERTNGDYYDVLEPLGGILEFISTQIPNNYRITYRSSRPVPDGTPREVIVTVTDQGEEATCRGVYTPGSAPQIQRTTATLDLHNRPWAEGTSLTISAEIKDAVPPYVQSTLLFTRTTGEPTYVSEPMSRTSDVWTGTIGRNTAKPPGIDYYIQATDGQTTVTSPSLEPRTYPHQLAILPNVAPAITHSAPAGAVANTPLPIVAQVVDSTNTVASARLHYRAIGQLTFQSSGEMEKIPPNTYQETIPGDAVGNSGVEYYIFAQDDLGTGSYSGTPDDPHRILLSSTSTAIWMTKPVDGEVVVGDYKLSAETNTNQEVLNVEFQFLHPGTGTWADIGMASLEPYQVGPFSYSQDDVGTSRTARAVALLDDGTTVSSEAVTFHYEFGPGTAEILFDTSLNSGKRMAVVAGSTSSSAPEFYEFLIGPDVQALEFYVLRDESDPALVKVYNPNNEKVIDCFGGKVGYYMPSARALEAYRDAYHCFTRDSWEYIINGKSETNPAGDLSSGRWSIAVEGGRFRILILATPQAEPGSNTRIRPISAYCTKYEGDGDYVQFYPFSGVISVTAPELNPIRRKQPIPVWVDVIPDFGPTGPLPMTARVPMGVYDPMVCFWVDLSKGDIPKGEFKAAAPSAPFSLEDVGKLVFMQVIKYLAKPPPVASLMLTMVDAMVGILAKGRYEVSAYGEVLFFESGSQFAEILVRFRPLVDGVTGCKGYIQEHSFLLSFDVGEDTFADDLIARQYMPNIYQLRCDAEEPKRNDVVKVGYQVEGTGELSKINYNIVFRDEDEPNFDEQYDWLRHALYKRTQDIEGFTLTVNNRTGEVEGIEFDKTWYNGWTYYDDKIIFHALPITSEICGASKTFTGTAGFTETDGHINLYVGTWNHLFSDTSDVGSDAPCSDWVLAASAAMDDARFTNKSREWLDAECRSNVLTTAWDQAVEFVGSIAQNALVEIGEFAVSPSWNRLNTTLSWPGSKLDLILIDPEGQAVEEGYPGAEFDDYPGLVIATISSPIEGTWKARAFGRDVPDGKTEYVAVFAAEEGTQEPVEPPPEEPGLGMLQIRSNGPIDIALRDPEGRVISKEFPAVEGIEYVERFNGAVGSNVDEITIPKRMVGDYQIRVMPEPGAERLQRFDLFVTDGFDTVTLAKRKFIIHVPKEPYVIRCTETSFFDATGLPEPQPNEEPNPSRALSTIILVLITVGGIVVVGGIAGLIYFLRSHYYI